MSSTNSINHRRTIFRLNFFRPMGLTNEIVIFGEHGPFLYIREVNKNRMELYYGHGRTRFATLERVSQKDDRWGDVQYISLLIEGKGQWIDMNRFLPKLKGNRR
jgi:hypothetical protein